MKNLKILTIFVNMSFTILTVYSSIYAITVLHKEVAEAEIA
jgi:hypothetical protein